MPRGRLDEITVQKAAVAWLSNYYGETKPEISAITSELEARIKKENKLGWGRADGLIAAELADGSIFTASIEAKSWRTLHNVSLSNDDEKWVIHAFIFGIAMAVVAVLERI